MTRAPGRGKEKTAYIWLLILLLSGCSIYELPALSENHPANPNAVGSAERTRSKTLAYTQSDIPSARPIADAPAARERGHQSHGGNQSEVGGQKTVTGEGKVVATVAGSGQLVVEHGEIKGFMEAMTMGYPVDPPSLLEGLKPGDPIRFTIDVPKKTILKIEKLK